MTPTRSFPLVARALAALVLGALVFGGAKPSGATFVAESGNPGTAFAAAADFNTVAVSLANPGTNLRGAVPLSATASSDRGIATVTFQRLASGTWTDICTATAAPYTCGFDTTAAGDGAVDLRAVATDAAGYSRTDARSGALVDNTAPATTLSAGTPLNGTVSLSGTASDSGSGLAATKLQYKLSSGSTWTDVCAAATCTWNTAPLADGSYDVRILATDAAGNQGSTVVTSRVVDNHAPTITMTSPGATVGGSPVTLRSTSSDGAGSGVASVQYLYRASGAPSWTALPGATWDTSGLPEGTYDLEAIATDGVGLTKTSAPVTGIKVDHTAPTASPISPPAPIHGSSVTMDPGVSDSDVAYVDYYGRQAGTTTWYYFARVTAAPWTITGDTRPVPDGVYELQVVVTDKAGNTTTKPFPGTITIDNTAPVAKDVQGANGTGSVAGQIDAGDTLTFTYSEPIAPASLDPGWDGSAKPVTVTVTDAGLSDTLEVYDGTRVALTAGQPLQLGNDWVASTTSFPATLTQSGSAVRLTFNGGGSLTGVTGTAPMTWTPSTAATDLAGNAAAATAVTETGAADVDF
jgi:hypothetical protein